MKLAFALVASVASVASVAFVAFVVVACAPLATTSEGEGAGEGEPFDPCSEGEGIACDPGVDFACAGLDLELGPGDGVLTASDPELIADTTNAACTRGRVNECDLIQQGTACFSFDITVTGTTPAAIIANKANWITFLETPPNAAFSSHACNGGAVNCVDDGAGDTICVCGLCIVDEPTDLAAAVSVGGHTSNGACVVLP